MKLAVKGGAHRKGVSRTSNRSDVLLLGSPPRDLFVISAEQHFWHAQSSILSRSRVLGVFEQPVPRGKRVAHAAFFVS